MHKLVSIAVAGAAMALINASPSLASVISFSSHAGGGGQTCYGNAASLPVTFNADGKPTNLGSGSDCVQITPHALWKPGAQANVFADTSAASTLTPAPVWISYADTGIGGNTLATPTGNTNPSMPNMIITQEFDLASAGLASLRQWADDTVFVYIDGDSLVDANVSAPNFSQSTCANGSPGCEPGESSFGQVNLDAGHHVFTWLVWQVGTGQDTNSNPFGLLYAGVVSVPEPGALGLLGLGLLGLVGFARRRAA